MSVIALDGLTKRFGDIVAVDDLTVQLERGRVIGLLGPNGAGKTTTLRMLLGLVAPSSGSATIDGRPYRALDEPIRRVGAVLEATSFHPGRRACDHLRVLATTAGIAEHRADEVLAGVGLDGAARRRVGGFSLGMRQRLGLAAALLGDPDVLVLDEPTNGLDPEGIRWLRDFVRAYAASGRTVLVSSHLLAEVAQTVDEVVVLTGGRLVAHAPLSELLRGRTVVRIRTPDAAALLAALDARGIHAELSTADLVLAHGATSEAVGRAIAATGLVAYEISQLHRDLEQAFLDLTTTTTTTGAPR
jgi:ABC-2 type transport system ATP-binding protein